MGELIGPIDNMEKYYDPVKKIITVPEVQNLLIQPGGLGRLLHERMRDNQDEIAMIDAPTGKTITFATYLQRCIRTAIKMKELGIGKDDIISICSSNTLDSSVPFIASLFIGAVTSALDPTLSLDDTKYLISLTKPKLIFTADNAIELIYKAVEAQDSKDMKIVSFGNKKLDLCIQFSDFVSEMKGEHEFLPIYIENPRDIAIILYSSGTTGMPKGICLSHEFVQFHSLDSKKLSSLAFTTLYWATCTFFTLSSCLAGSFRIVVPQGYTPEGAWKYLEKYKPDFLFLAPCDAIAFYNARPEKVTYAPLVFASGGSHLSDDYIIKIREMFPKTFVAVGYAQTELMVLFGYADRVSMKKISSCGRPLPGRSYKVVNTDTGENCGPNERGELRVKTRWCMNGYYKHDSRDAWDEEGFLKTGDVVYYDEEFCFFVVDRIKEMFKYRSWHIVPAKVEMILQQHPDVQYCAVIGIPHLVDGHHAAAVVQLWKGRETTAEELQKFMDEKTDERHKLRGGVHIIENFPFTPSGKIKRSELRKKFAK